MQSPELSILVLNLIIICIAYFSIYPKLAGNNFNKLSFYDAFASGFALFIVGINYWGSDQQFNLFIYNTNWFWFALITYLLIELPFVLWYIKNKKVKI